MTGKPLPKYPLLFDEFVNDLTAAAVDYDAHAAKTDKDVWYLATRTNTEWESNYSGEAGVSKAEFYAQASAAINAAMNRKRLTPSGETLRRWCDIAAAFRDMPGAAEFVSTLPFEVFRVSRMLGKDPKNNKDNLTHYALVAIAYKENLSADELVERYGKHRNDSSEYDHVTGWLDSLESAKYEWLNGSKAEFLRLIARMREIVREQTGVVA